MTERRPISIIPYEHAHYAMLPLRPEQQDELDRMGQIAGRAADMGPAFSAVECDERGAVAKVLACAGLAEILPVDHPGGGIACAWAAFAEGPRPAQWSAITHAIRAVLAGADYARIEMMVRNGFEAAERYAEALGFALDQKIYARRGGAAASAAQQETR